MATRAEMNLLLAKWLLGPDAIQPCEIGGQVCLRSWIGSSRIFDPFADSNNGRQQFAECFVKAVQAGFNPCVTTTRADAGRLGRCNRVPHDNTPPDITAATLEAIFLAARADMTPPPEGLPW